MILHTRKDTAQDDMNDWGMHYPPHLVAWVSEICERLEWQLTPPQALECEMLYPRLLDDIAIYLWQRRLITKQEEGEHGG